MSTIDHREAPGGAASAKVGRFALLRELGKGGMGVVYAAYDEPLDRRVAIKFLHAGRDDERSQQRMHREAQALARLSHPNVVQVYEVGLHDGAIFVAMEFVTGQTLGAWTKAAARERAELLDAYLQAGRGLAAAHSVGLVHRDFKPDNCMRADDGRVRVLDFGLARVDTAAAQVATTDPEPSSPESQSLTRTGLAAGTPAYMAPEQFNGDEIDARADQFAFCIALWEALCGQRPFAGTTRMSIAQAVTSGTITPPPPGKLPSDVHAALRRGLAVAPAERWSDMDALLGALAHDPARRSRRVVIGVAAAVAIGGAVWVATIDRGPTCAGADALLAETWGPAQRGSIEAAFARSNKPFAAPTLQTVLAELDTYAASWIASRTDACVATHERGDQSAQMLDHRTACLDRHARELGILIELLGDADDGVIEHAGDALRTLAPNRRCADTEALLAEVEPTDTPEQRADAESIRAEIFRARALHDAGKYDDGKAAATLAVTHAEALGYRPVIAEAWVQLGYAQDQDGEGDAAIPSLHRAAQLAHASGNDRVLAWAWIRLGWTLGAEGNRDAALRWLDYAESANERFGQDYDLEAEIRAARGSAHLWAADFASALVESDAVLEISQRWGVPFTAKDQAQRGNALVGLGRYDEAVTTLEEGIARATERWGPTHPVVAMLHNDLGVATYQQGDLAASAEHFDTAYRITSAALGPDHPDILFSLGNLGEIQRTEGKYDEALATANKVLALVEKTYPPVHRDVGTTKHNIGTILRERGDAEAALPMLAAALAVREQVHGADHAYVANTLTEQGLALLALHRSAEAVAALERAHTIRGTSEVDLRARGETAFALARALDESGGDRERARSLARAAAEDLRGVGAHALAKRTLVEVDAFLAR